MKALAVRDVMTNLVVSLRPGDTIQYAAGRLLHNRISGAPVVDGGRVVGVVSESDLIAAYRPVGRTTRFLPRHPMFFLMREGGVPLERLRSTVGEVMSTGVISVLPDEPVWEAATLIDRYGVRRLPVIDEGGTLVGVITRSDLVRAMVLGEPIPAEPLPHPAI